jgi:hypothetical protein
MITFSRADIALMPVSEAKLCSARYGGVDDRTVPFAALQHRIGPPAVVGRKCELAATPVRRQWLDGRRFYISRSSNPVGIFVEERARRAHRRTPTARCN